MIKKMLCVVLSFVVFFAGCAGREPNPVPLNKPGDKNLNCESLKSEVMHLQKEMVALLPKTKETFQTNAILATTGVLFIVPFFFMDLKAADKKEFEAMRLRHNRLLDYLKAKNCDTSDITAEPIPSLEQQQKQVEEMLKRYQAESAKDQNQPPAK